MWFLNTATRRLEAFNNETDIVGGYAILSHRWAKEEVTFDEIHLPEAKLKQGYRKIEHACNQAIQHGHRYIWIDTCCIDKRSSAELSEAVNSMFRWYQNARVCYVYLIDFEYGTDLSGLETHARFQSSIWWSRGWTLQELIAPERVFFYDHGWHYYGSKAKMIDRIHSITNIDVQVLRDRNALQTTSIATRMSWAAKRVTSREEDQAYSLLGLFNVNMPLLYGEGGVKAFYRLQEEIIRTSSFADHSILAWKPWEGGFGKTWEDAWEGGHPVLNVSSFAGYAEPANYQNLLAPSPYGFRHTHDVVSWGLPQQETFILTSRGLRLSLFVKPNEGADTGVRSAKSLTAILNCRYVDERMSYIIIWLEKRLRVEEGLPKELPSQISRDDIYDRSHRNFRTGIHSRRLNSIAASEVGRERLELTLAREPFIWPQFEDRIHITGTYNDRREFQHHEKGDLTVIETFPSLAFDSGNSILSLTKAVQRYNAMLNPAYGAVVLGRLNDRSDDFVLTVDRLSAGNQSPRLLAAIFARHEHDSLERLPTRTAVSLIPDQTSEFKTLGSATVTVTARCVIVSGELFWSLHVLQDFSMK